MSVKGCIAMILAGGRGERLGSLTRYYPKPAVHFGGKHRIIDFTLNNCKCSGIDTIGILSQYFSGELHAYIESAYDCRNIYMLPSQDDVNCYKGTADAVYKNIHFMERFHPEHVLVLAGDHIYTMDYGRMIDFHRKTGADVTVASTPVSMQEASRFGILEADESGHVCSFEEKPRRPKSSLASMGIYVFKWEKLKKYLLADSVAYQTQHDFGRDILPEMLRAGERMYTYKFSGYWRDVGTVDSLLGAHMDQIDHPAGFRFFNDEGETPVSRVGGIAWSVRGPEIYQSIIPKESSILGRVKHSVLSDWVTVGEGAEIVDSYVMPGAYIGNNVKLYKTVVGTRAVIMDNAVIGAAEGSDCFIDCKVCVKDVSLVSPWLHIAEGMKFQAGSHLYKECMQEAGAHSNEAEVIRSVESGYPGSLLRHALSARR